MDLTLRPMDFLDRKIASLEESVVLLSEEARSSAEEVAGGMASEEESEYSDMLQNSLEMVRTQLQTIKEDHANLRDHVEDTVEFFCEDTKVLDNLFCRLRSFLLEFERLCQARFARMEREARMSRTESSSSFGGIEQRAC